jgi:hypothetical protein
MQVTLASALDKHSELLLVWNLNKEMRGFITNLDKILPRAFYGANLQVPADSGINPVLQWTADEVGTAFKWLQASFNTGYRANKHAGFVKCCMWPDLIFMMARHRLEDPSGKLSTKPRKAYMDLLGTTILNVTFVE